jgi:hypothetical protein
MITCSPPRFALPPSRVIDASSHLRFRAAGSLRYLLAVLGVAPVRAGEAKLVNPQASLAPGGLDPRGQSRLDLPHLGGVSPHDPSRSWASPAHEPATPARCRAMDVDVGSNPRPWRQPRARTSRRRAQVPQAGHLPNRGVSAGQHDPRNLVGGAVRESNPASGQWHPTAPRPTCTTGSPSTPASQRALPAGSDASRTTWSRDHGSMGESWPRKRALHSSAGTPYLIEKGAQAGPSERKPSAQVTVVPSVASGSRLARPRR